jgi:hypothetical protein
VTTISLLFSFGLGEAVLYHRLFWKRGFLGHICFCCYFSFHRVINDPSIMNAATSAATIATVGFACAVWA